MIFHSYVNVYERVTKYEVQALSFHAMADEKAKRTSGSTSGIVQEILAKTSAIYPGWKQGICQQNTRIKQIKTSGSSKNYMFGYVYIYIHILRLWHLWVFHMLWPSLNSPHFRQASWEQHGKRLKEEPPEETEGLGLCHGRHIFSIRLGHTNIIYIYIFIYIYIYLHI